MKSKLRWFVIVVAILLAVFFMGPRPDANETITFAKASLGEDLDAYLANSEANIPNIVEGAEKEIIWTDPSNKQKTPFSIVYLHGFSASKGETRPLSDMLAKSLGANLYYTRLAGHGAGGKALGDATMNQWANDVAEAIGVGEAIGEKVIIVGASTGSTLATWAAAKPDMNANIHAMALVSPNYAVHAAPTGLMNMPWAETILPALLGAERSFEAKSPEHEKWWTTSYPSKAVFPMAALLKVVEGVDKSKITIPTMFIYSSKDVVVVPAKIEEAIADWGGPTKTMIVDNSDDEGNHVIAGDIRSPSTTEPIAKAVTEWLQSL